ncbi:hypothetical protein O3Q51_11915 [Cryomorphaceae bacterium 1068]|nr:hypothetical protein [Cryomorphaceae bacterium 1068]
MSFRNLSILLFACFVFTSCEEDKLAKYEGIWEGAYIGDEEGTWKIRIQDNGVSEGVAYPSGNEGDQSFVFVGSVNEEGELVMSATVFGRVAIYEAFLTETDLSGSWSDEEGDFSGTWSGTKRKQEDQFPYGLLLNP